MGQTVRRRNKTRMNAHRFDWTKRKFETSPVAEHFHLHVYESPFAAQNMVLSGRMISARPVRATGMATALTGLSEDFRGHLSLSIQLTWTCFNSHVSLFCIEHDAQWSDDTKIWVHRLNTIQPHGINKKNLVNLCPRF